MSSPQSAPVIRLLSAGGVVVREGDGGPEVALCGHIEGDGHEWGLPKGTPEPGETRRETAAREVREETGLEVVIEDYIGEIEYTFPWPDGSAPAQEYEGEAGMAHKTVLYYLMSAVGGSTALHDHEFDEVRWFPASEAERAVRYENEAGMVRQGVRMAAERE